MTYPTKSLTRLCTAVSAFALIACFSQSASAQNIPLPQSDSKAVNSGAALLITNTGTNASARVFAIEGSATGKSGAGVAGIASAKKSIGVYGVNSGSGNAGEFIMSGIGDTFGQTAVYGVNTGGLKGAGQGGRYGSAGHFEITNTNNFDTVLVGLTHSVTGTAIEGDDFSSGGDGGGGFGVLGQSTEGVSGQFTGGSQGSGTCNYRGGPGWNCPSTTMVRKAAFSPADENVLLDRLAALPLFEYAMPGATKPARYLGPAASDFHAAFKLGDSDIMINSANAQGVALAAAKGLYEKVKLDEKRIAELEKIVAEQKVALSDVAALKASVAALQAAANPVREASFRP
jgi:hypothetical protein